MDSRLYEICDNMINEENSFYNNIIEKEYNEQNYKNPYIPNPFRYIEGEWNNGFVIEDNLGNQYVWVPCSNVESKGSPILKKRYFSDMPLISKDFCYDMEYKEFLQCALKYGGYYISRYEIGVENGNFVSKSGVEVLTNITQNEAKELSEKMYNNESIKCELINGFAYDTALEWINNTNKVDINNTYTEEKIITGRNSPYNNIFDINDNILELTMEKNIDTSIVRGFYNNKIFEKYSWVDNQNNRYSIIEDEKYDYIAMRTIIYKK